MDVKRVAIAAAVGAFVGATVVWQTMAWLGYPSLCVGALTGAVLGWVVYGPAELARTIAMSVREGWQKTRWTAADHQDDIAGLLITLSIVPVALILGAIIAYGPYWAKIIANMVAVMTALRYLILTDVFANENRDHYFTTWRRWLAFVEVYLIRYVCLGLWHIARGIWWLLKHRGVAVLACAIVLAAATAAFQASLHIAQTKSDEVTIGVVWIAAVAVAIASWFAIAQIVCWGNLMLRDRQFQETFEDGLSSWGCDRPDANATELLAAAFFLIGMWLFEGNVLTAVKWYVKGVVGTLVGIVKYGFLAVVLVFSATFRAIVITSRAVGRAVVAVHSYPRAVAGFDAGAAVIVAGWIFGSHPAVVLAALITGSALGGLHVCVWRRLARRFAPA